MRARTTWNRESIKASAKTAEDPRAMNQDHFSQQPKADAYVNGDPSSWAEDVHKPNSWEVEYSGGATKRDEIGMPELRPETYNHPEKTANMDESFLAKKAGFTVKLAKMMLGNAVPEAKVEDQAVALMHMPDDALISTYNTLAEKLGAEGQFPGGQYPTAEQQQQSQQQQVAQYQQQAATALQSGDFEQAKMAIEQCMAQQQGQQQQVMANATQVAPTTPVAAPAKPAPVTAPVVTPDIQAVVTAAVNAALKQAGFVRANDQQGQGQKDQGQQKQTQANQQQGPQQGQGQQQQAQAQQNMQQQAEQQAQQMQQAQQQQQMQSDDALLDELMMSPGQEGVSESDIELEAPGMDVGEVQLGPEDDVLKTLFANEETQAAEQAQQGQQDQGQQQKQAGMGRTASTRTVGARPTGGVSKIGGGVAAPAASGGRTDIDKLSALWPSAPDVRSAFNMGS